MRRSLISSAARPRISRRFSQPSAAQPGWAARAAATASRTSRRVPLANVVAGENKGGIVLLKLRRISAGSEDRIYLRTSYEDRNGRRDGSEAVVTLWSTPPEYFPNSGIRKGVLLTRYAALLKNWMTDERQHLQYSRPWEPVVSERDGIILPPENVGQWERTSLPLTVSPGYKRVFSDFTRYFEQEMRNLDDNTLRQELSILDRLSR